MLMSHDLEVPANILADPRHLVPGCVDCLHRREEGLCGLDLHPTNEWAKDEGCLKYDPLKEESSGDPGPNSILEY